MAAKDRHTTKILEYLSNPSNTPCDRSTIAIKVLKFKGTQALYKVFTPAELSELERQGLETRRTKYSPEIAEVDAGLLRRAKEGDPQAAKLVYQRFEGWTEKHKFEHKGALNVRFEVLKKKIQETPDV